MSLPGVTKGIRKDGTIYFRSSITIQSKHISLGSFPNIKKAHQAYLEACDIIRNQQYQLNDYNKHFALDFYKFIILMNYRNSGVYFKTPIYLHSNFFYYYLSPQRFLIFDREDLFFYANHKIQTRGGYLFICNYGSQYSILSRYGIKPYAQKGTDYIFVNQNDCDFRYENIKIINEYMGVHEFTKDNSILYECTIHINGNVLVGRYSNKHDAAIAYNKAIDYLHVNGITKQYIKNYIPELTSEKYHEIYDSLSLSKKLKQYTIGYK